MLSKKTIRWFLIGFLLIMSFSAVATVFAETKTCSVTLKKSPKTKKKTIQTGDSIVLTLKYKKRVVSSDKAVFTSTKPAVAEVSADGVITARNTGKTYIYARYKKALAKIRITVKAADTSASAAALADTDDIIYFTEDTTEKMLAVKTVSTKSVTSSANSSLRTRIVEYAKGFVGVLPYVWAGNSLTTGTDCSGFIHLIFAKFGISAPRSASDYQRITNIDEDELLPGDVVVYKNGGHVALYIGDGKVCHAKGKDYGTVIDKMTYGTPTGFVRLIKN